jgi:ribokinase
MHDSERLELIKSSKVCVIMDPPVEAATELARICAENGVVVIWDPGVYANEGFETLMPVLENTDYFILNHVEYENLVGTSDPEKVGSILDEKVKGIKAIIKRGSEGSILCHEASGIIVQVDAVPLERLDLKVVNTVGCGDAYIGAFASALVEGKGDIDALREASAAGSFKATRIETRGGPTREEIRDLMDRWNQL